MTQDDDAGVSLAKDQGPAPGYPGEPPGPGGAMATPVRRGLVPNERVITIGAYVLLGILGIVFGLIGSFGYSWTVASLPVASLALIAATFALVWLAGLGMGGKLGAAVPWISWMVVVIVLSSRRTEGDLVIAGDAAGYLFLVGGMIAGGIAVAITRSAGPSGGWLLGAGPRGPGDSPVI